ncbi:hypothetical protein COEREDRAFT_11433, partial [Coemansia reversa NRRL 1564]
MFVFNFVKKIVHRRKLRVRTLVATAAARVRTTTRHTTKPACPTPTPSVTTTSSASILPTVRALVFSASNTRDASNTTTTPGLTNASALLDTPDTLEALVTPSASVTPDISALSDAPAALAVTDTDSLDIVVDKRASIASTVTVVVPEAPKSVTKAAIDYAADHVGLLGEQPISATEISEFEKDAGSSGNSHVSEYNDDIFGYMREREVKMTPDSDYIERQPEMTWK